MRQFLQIILILLTVNLISACGAGSEEDGTGTNQGPNNTGGLQLANIGNRSILSGDSLNISLSASNPDGGNLTWSADGTVGPNNNPLLAGASFDENAHQFSWANTSTATGSYNIRFTVTDDSVPPQTDSETILIVVQDIFSYGESSYNQYCQSCHGDEGIGGREQLLQCILEPDLAFGMSRSPMSSIGNQWSDYDREFDAILYYLQNVQPQNC